MKVVEQQVNRSLLHLCELLEYPRADFKFKLAKAREEVSRNYPETKSALNSFADSCTELTAGQMEEVFTRTFDLAAICSPYISGYIYGSESYDRGTLMAQLSEKLIELDIDRGGELPDHLKLLLKMAAYCNEEELHELCIYCLSEPVKAMKDSLSSTNSSINPYFYLMQVIHILVERWAGRMRSGHA